MWAARLRGRSLSGAAKARMLKRSDEYVRRRTCRVARPRTPRSRSGASSRIGGMCHAIRCRSLAQRAGGGGFPAQRVVIVAGRRRDRGRALPLEQPVDRDIGSVERGLRRSSDLLRGAVKVGPDRGSLKPGQHHRRPLCNCARINAVALELLNQRRYPLTQGEVQLLTGYPNTP